MSGGSILLSLRQKGQEKEGRGVFSKGKAGAEGGAERLRCRGPGSSDGPGALGQVAGVGLEAVFTQSLTV